MLLNLILLLGVAWLVHKWLYSIPSNSGQKKSISDGDEGLGKGMRGFPGGSGSSRNPKKWKQHVRSPPVEAAWEKLCGSIIQEFIYDTWYASLTPDREFPAEIRRILNHAFGQLARRARRVNLRGVLEDTSELLMEQLELYRDTRESVAQSCQKQEKQDFLQLDLETRECMLRKKMVIEGNLHPAMMRPDGNYKMLRDVADGLVERLLSPADNQGPLTRSIARELLSSCVLKPLMMFCTPYHVNKGIYHLLKMQQARQEQGTVMSSPEKMPRGATNGNDQHVEKVRGHQEFEKRIAMAAQAETYQQDLGHTSILNSARSKVRSARTHTQPQMLRQEAFNHKQTPGNLLRSRSSGDLSTAPLAEPNGAGLDEVSLNGGRKEDAFSVMSSSNSTPTFPLMPTPFQSRFQSYGAGVDEEKTPSMKPLASEPAQQLSGNTEGENGHLIAFRPPLNGYELSVSAVNAAATAVAVATTATAGFAAVVRSGFVGRPKARVVAADLVAGETKDYVLYKIRVGDDTGREWTVSRRFRHFEILHRQLKNLPGYRATLPAKRLFNYTHSAEFVEERRRSLNAFLQAILSLPSAAKGTDVWDFLDSGSERFGLPARQGEDGDFSSLVAQNTTSTLISDPGHELYHEYSYDVMFPSASAPASLRKKGAISRTVKVAKNVSKGVVGAAVDVTHAAIRMGVSGMSDIMSDAVQEAKSSLTGKKHHRRSMSINGELSSLADHSPSSNLPTGEEYEKDEANASFDNSCSDEKSVNKGGAMDESCTSMLRGKEVRSQSASQAINMASLSRRENKQVTSSWSGPISQTSKSKKNIPKVRNVEVSSTPKDVGDPLQHQIRSPYLESPATPFPGGDWYDRYGGLDPASGSGISAPLYELVDSIFQLQTRGFFRRQVFSIARQVLSFAIGDAIDVYLLEKLRMLRQEAFLAHSIHSIQAALWPGGVWFQNTASFRALHETLSSGPPRSPLHRRPGNGIRPDDFLTPM